MLDRCRNPTCANYTNYGGRGITVCTEWCDNINMFYDWTMSHGYNDNLTIDRIDVNGNYEPTNCRWVDMTVQGSNRRNTIYLDFGGICVPLKKVMDLTGYTRNYCEKHFSRVHINKNYE